MDASEEGKAHELSLLFRVVISLYVGGFFAVNLSQVFNTTYLSAAGTVNILEKTLELDNSVKRYSFQELENATKHFKDTLGKGSLGPVYRGRLSDGTDVAIKMRSDGLHLNDDSFLKEV